MKIRFQADNDLDQRIVVATKRLDPTINFQTAHALMLHGVPDTLVLERTADAGRVLVSHDRRTLPRFFGEFISTNFAWTNHCLSEIASPKSSGTSSLALGVKPNPAMAAST